LRAEVDIALFNGHGWVIKPSVLSCISVASQLVVVIFLIDVIGNEGKSNAITTTLPQMKLH